MESKLTTDFWLISNNLQHLVSLTDIIPDIKTDRSAIFIDINNCENCVKGPGHWKMNVSLLEDEEYIKDITEKYQFG